MDDDRPETLKDKQARWRQNRKIRIALMDDATREALRLKKNESNRLWKAAHPLSDEARKRSSEQASVWAREHPERVAEIKQRWRENHADEHRERTQRYSWKAYGLPEPTRPMPELCEGCGQRNTRLRNRDGYQRLHLDHDHETGAFRGWLCMRCNLAAGRFEDSPALLRGLADYLERNKI